MTKVSLQSDSKEISKTAKKGLGNWMIFRLELANNKTEDGLTKALTDYNKLGSELLTSAINNDAKTYQANGQGFFKQAVSVGEKYFGDQIPQSPAILPTINKLSQLKVVNSVELPKRAWLEKFHPHAPVMLL